MKLLVGSLLWGLAFAVWADMSLAREKELIHLVRQDCGACHGMRLSGGLGVPLTREALRDKPPESLVATIIYGRPGTPMPAWKSLLTEQDAQWIVKHLIDGFPLEDH